MMEELAARAIAMHEHYLGSPWLVAPSIPVLYFGDRPSYDSSAIRILTVGLNPSRREFPNDNPWKRFSSQIDVQAYFRSLNSYFERDPLGEWFRSYEAVLHGLGCSYYAGEGKGRALHIDIASPLATDPTWAKLDRDIKSKLQQPGLMLWRDLVTALQPDILIMSIARNWLTTAFREDVAEWGDICRLHNTKAGAPRIIPYRVAGKWLVAPTSKPFLCIYAPAAQTPFGSVSGDQKRLVGADILAHFERGLQ